MSNVISVENLGKKYTISHQQRGDTSSLREVITNGISSFGKKIISPLRRCSGQAFTPFDYAQGTALPHDPAVEDFWALKDVSFEVKQGDRIGIIGRNGAGKSTLLKILSRITEPTTGRIKIKGRVASLLEVGTGFHPELTGRENIYLNGAILGMGRQEISRKFDEIVAFAEIEKFLDTPVKRYSSGMYVRLAFAVAAHLEPEILIVDEVLAVGDAGFQKKCLGKMEEVGREGRTVLFVSHNLRAISNLCESAILVKNGLLSIFSNSEKVIHEYLKSEENLNIHNEINNFIMKLPEDVNVKLLNIRILNDDIAINNKAQNGKDINIEISYKIIKKTYNLLIFIRLSEQDDNLIFHSINGSNKKELITFEPGTYISTVTIPANFLAERTYILQIGMSIHKTRRCMPEWLRIQLDVVNTSCVDKACTGVGFGILSPLLDWKTSQQVCK